MSKNFFLNGHEFKTKEEITLNEIINYFDYKNSFYIIEHNNLICGKNRWESIEITSNDKIEIISIVGGG